MSKKKADIFGTNYMSRFVFTTIRHYFLGAANADLDRVEEACRLYYNWLEHTADEMWVYDENWEASCFQAASAAHAWARYEFESRCPQYRVDDIECGENLWAVLRDYVTDKYVSRSAPF